MNLTVLTLLSSVVILLYGEDYIKLGLASMLCIVIILGNLICIWHVRDIQRYCNLANKDLDIINKTNILTHWVLPYIVLFLLFKNMNLKKRNIYINSVMYVITISVIYMSLMKLELVSSYGLDLREQYIYGLLAVAIGIIAPKIILMKDR